MKIKFVGGPKHGQTADVNLPPHTDRIVVSVGPKYPWVGDDVYVRAESHVYSMRMMGVTINGVSYRAPAMHPDGSVFFVHERYKK